MKKNLLVLFFLSIDMPAVMSKVRACADVSWYDIFDMSTRLPAKYLGLGHLGSLGVGSGAGVWVLTLLLRR